MFEYLDPNWWCCLGRVGGVVLLEEEGRWVCRVEKTPPAMTRCSNLCLWFKMRVLSFLFLLPSPPLGACLHSAIMDPTPWNHENK